MYNQVHVFDFSFVAPNGRRRTKPQLVFTISKNYFPELTRRLNLLASRATFELYFKNDVRNEFTNGSKEFCLPLPDLFGRVEIGFGPCGLVTESEEEVSLHLELAYDKLYFITATIHVLTMALRVPYEPRDTRSNCSQQIDLETNCEHRSMGYGHAVGGYISADVRNWLRRQGAHLDNHTWVTEAPPQITEAMQQAWKAVASKESRKWASESRAYIAVDGRFILQCMGNACDVSIYPDSHSGAGESIRFGCHNLDAARQQITLLAGLAKLCELARSDVL